MKLYDTSKAAQYLKMTVSALKYHVHIARNITPQKLGRTLIFTQEQLDEFQANRRPQGRPRKESNESA